MAQDMVPEWTELPTETPIKAKIRLPDGMTYQIGKQDYKCFSTPEYKDLLLLTNEYQALYDWRVDHEIILNTFKMMGEIYDTRVDNFTEQVSFLKTERNSLVAQIKSDHKYILRLKEQEGRASIGWKIVAGIEMAGLVALSITAAVK
jgi:uncharacterized protein YeeX (DUF496 family)